jgi:hypothetical protein
MNDEPAGEGFPGKPDFGLLGWKLRRSWPIGSLAVGTMLLGMAAALGAAGPDDTLLPPRAAVTAAPVVPVQLTPDKPGTVELIFRVAAGFHINSNRPKDQLLQPTTLRLNPPTDIVVAKVKYPAGQDLSFSFLPGETLNVYTGDFSITALVTVARAVPFGTYRVHASLRYQACDNRQCYPAREVPVDFDVKVQKKKTPHPVANPGQSPHVHS